jgi:RHS repeat-associated protein
LDYFIARYYSGALGRFTSPDPLLGEKEWLVDPQRWNRYAYVRNNPLRFIDPDGEDLTIYLYYGSDLTKNEKEFLEKYNNQIQDHITKKFKDAGIEKVNFVKGKTKEQLEEIQQNLIEGEVILQFSNLQYKTSSGERRGVDAGLYGGSDRRNTAVVFMGNLSRETREFNDALVLATGEVASHEIGETLTFDKSNMASFLNIITFEIFSRFRSNIMDDNQAFPTREKKIDKYSEHNKRVIERINDIGE